MWIKWINSMCAQNNELVSFSLKCHWSDYLFSCLYYKNLITAQKNNRKLTMNKMLGLNSLYLHTNKCIKHPFHNITKILSTAKVNERVWFHNVYLYKDNSCTYSFKSGIENNYQLKVSGILYKLQSFGPQLKTSIDR